MKKTTLTLAAALLASLWPSLSSAQNAPPNPATCSYPRGVAKINTDPNYLDQLKNTPLDAWGEKVCAALRQKYGGSAENDDLCRITRAYIKNLCSGRDGGWPVALSRLDYVMKGFEQEMLTAKKPVAQE